MTTEETANSKKFPAHLVAAPLLMAASILCLKEGIEPFVSFFYSFMWWSYILLADALIYLRKGESLFTTRRAELKFMLPASLGIWLAFEMANLSLKNWYYIEVNERAWARWVFGYPVAYSTVLPGIFNTCELLDTFGLFKKTGRPAMSFKKWHWPVMMAAGAALTIASIAVPRYFFPFIWVGPIFMIDPLNRHFGAKSVLKELEEEGAARIYRLMTAGIICGLLWETWNFWAVTKWIYTVPFFEEGKLFEMPLPGFLGFMPFAVECYVIYEFLNIFRGRKSRGRDSRPQVARRDRAGPFKYMIATAFVAYCFFAFHMIDTYNVESFAPKLADVEGIDLAARWRLEAAGIEDPHDLLKTVKTGKKDLKTLSAISGLSGKEIDRIMTWSRVIVLKGIGCRNFYLLKKAGVDSLEKLAKCDAARLCEELNTLNSKLGIKKRPLREAVVRAWIRAARKTVKTGEKYERK